MPDIGSEELAQNEPPGKMAGAAEADARRENPHPRRRLDQAVEHGLDHYAKMGPVGCQMKSSPASAVGGGFTHDVIGGHDFS